MKTKRNELCPCGSGKKYKKCCIPRYKGKEKVHQSERKFGKREAGMLITQFLAMADAPFAARGEQRTPPRCLEDLE